MNSVKDTIAHIKHHLKDLYPQQEVQSFVQLIFEHVLNYSKIDLHLKSDTILSDEDASIIDTIVNQLKKHIPIQHIIGKTEFYDLEFDVTSDVLIPRQETEELVHWVINENKNKAVNILDIGTGSGCIPIVLAKNITTAKVDTLDVSKQAIKVAKQNAKKNNLDVSFYEVDILKWEQSVFPADKKYDIIVSNPPYVREQEKEMMHSNVLDHEPHLALFVTDEDPLIFYDAIARFAKEHLKPNGKLYFEINEYLAKEMQEMLSKYQFTNIIIKKDINEKDRMMSATLI